MTIYKDEKRNRQARLTHFEGLRFISDCDLIFCDIWGVVHNGVRAYFEAVAALSHFRKRGGRVILITNAPRPSFEIECQLRQMGVSASAYDLIISSGDLTKEALKSDIYGKTCYHLGPARDLGLFDDAQVQHVGVDSIARSREVFATAQDADFILCTGFWDDERETIQDYHDLLADFISKKLLFLCANPDLMVERDGKIVPCAGALARFYQELGGEVIYFGKPFALIYQKALSLLGAQNIKADKILAIGDGLATDMKGAQSMDYDSLLIISGIARDIEEKNIHAICQQHGLNPKGWMEQLKW